MHAPDGFLTASTAVATGALSAGTIGIALRQTRETLADRRIPLAGVAAAFIFAAQMINFPVAAGTTGHLLGGALAAILLGPHLGALAVTIVVVVQALVFADGGLTALGYNTLNLAIVPAYGGYAAFRLFGRLLPTTAPGVVGAAGLAGLASVVLSAASFSLQWLFGATAPISFAQVFSAMVGVHVLIGIGEGIITAATVAAVMVARSDLIDGGRYTTVTGHARGVRLRTVAIGGFLVALLVSTVASQFAATAPDGLERVARDTGITESAGGHALAGGVFAEYATAGLAHEGLSLAVAGATGTIIVLAVGSGLLLAARSSRRRPGTT